MTAAITTHDWDLAIVGAGPAGTATAIGALRAEPSLRVALLDRADFPRDKSCGDGIAPHVIDLLEEAGVTGVVDGEVPVHRLRLRSGAVGVERRMHRPAWVVPRQVFDHRLVTAAQAAGATLVRHRVRAVEPKKGGVRLDGTISARVLVGADGASSVVRRTLGARRGPVALALRGYAPTPPGRSGAQEIVFGTTRQPSYAWSFDRGDGLSNVGYGELLTRHRDRPHRAQLLEQLESLLPGATNGATDWHGHQLPLSTWRGPAASSTRGRILLVGDAAGLINPLTGEGIYYAVRTGLAAGRATAAALAADEPDTAGARYARTLRQPLARHLRHTALAARLCRNGRVLDAGLRASAADQRVFDDLVELGLARGRITATMTRGLAHALVQHGTLVRPRTQNDPASDTEET